MHYWTTGEFEFIAGYTEGGAPYGIRWDDDDDASAHERARRAASEVARQAARLMDDDDDLREALSEMQRRRVGSMIVTGSFLPTFRCRSYVW